MRVISTPITGSGLTRLGIDRSTDSPWFEPAPRTAAEWSARSGSIRNGLVCEDWFAVLGPAFGASGKAAERLQRASQSGFAVTTGQQPGLFGGPLYTWWKALTALALADRLETETGLPVVPIFWAATDDSDYAEGASTVVATNAGAEILSLPPLADTGRALAHVPLADVSLQIEKLIAASGSAPNHHILTAVQAAYSAGHSVGSAYVHLLRSILQPLGIAVIDAAHPAVRSAGFPVMQQALLRKQEIEDALVGRSADLKEKKLSGQVKIVKGRTLVFAERNGQRERVRSKDSANIADSAKPGDLGPNVLLRPIVERSIIPTAAYVGGPGEIAYFAQVTAVADALGTLRPVVVARWSGFVIEPRIDKILERYDVALEDLRDPHSVETKLARESLPPDVVAKIGTLRESFTRGVAELARAEGANLVSPAVLDGLTRNLAHRIERLERRYVAAVKRNGNEALREVAIARASLFPAGSPQERALNGVPLLARYGDDLIASVMAEVKLHARSI